MKIKENTRHVRIKIHNLGNTGKKKDKALHFINIIQSNKQKHKEEIENKKNLFFLLQIVISTPCISHREYTESKQQE